MTKHSSGRSSRRQERELAAAEAAKQEQCKSRTITGAAVLGFIGLFSAIGYGAAKSFDHGKEGAGIGAAAGATILLAGYGLFKACKNCCTFESDVKKPLMAGRQHSDDAIVQPSP